MKRGHPITSPFGVGFAAIFFVGMGLAFVLNGGMMFNPGGLSAKSDPGQNLEGYSSHVDFEKTCKKCHQPLETIQAELCLTCHKSVQDQISDEIGTHSMIDELNRCAVCHPDHRGREYDPNEKARMLFNHEKTSFSLLWHQVDYNARPMRCVICHLYSNDYGDVSQACLECHHTDNRYFMENHYQEYGDGCTSCHDGLDTIARFDHNSSSFPLVEKHELLNCSECHLNAVFEHTSSDCKVCHPEPKEHESGFEEDCNTCHSSEGWLPAIWNNEPFEHLENFSFSLAHHKIGYLDEIISCFVCHVEGKTTFEPIDCVGCHSHENETFMNQHIDQFGENCSSCHDGVDRMENFDHAIVFPLDGGHADVECEVCHENKHYSGLPADCKQCHIEPEIHSGLFGLNCQNCHKAEAWIPAKMTYHVFPLNHGDQGEVACEVCHVENYVAYTCYGCHDHQLGPIVDIHLLEGIAFEEISNCVLCHPNGDSELEGD